MKNDLINKLVETFKQEAAKYSNAIDGVVNFKFEEFFRKNNPEKGYQSIDALIIFKNFTMKLEYKVNMGILIPKSTVEMRFMFEEGKLPVEYSIYDLFNIIDKDNFRLYTFACVTNEAKMKEILKNLVDTFNQYKDKIEELSNNIEKITLLEKDVEEKINVLLNENVFKSRDAFYMMHMLELYYILDVSRFTMEGYNCYVEGKNKKALSKYKKLKGKLTSYEKRLIEYIKLGKVCEIVPNNLNTFSEAKRLKNARAEFFPMFLSWMVLTPIWGIVYDAIFYFAMYLLSKGTIYISTSHPYIMFLPAFITAIINSYFIRKLVYKLFFKKNYNKIIALDEIENNEKVEFLMMKLFQFIIALGLVFSILSANTNIAFYEEHFNNNLEFFNIKGETISYEDVECVYKTSKIKNDFGYVIDTPSYIIVLDGGRQINLYYHIDLENIEENIIPIFEKKNIQIKEIDLIDNVKTNLNKND